MIGHMHEHITRWLATAAPGQRFPALRVLARHWRCSPTTVRKAMAPFLDSGDLVSHPGKGVFARGLPHRTVLPSPGSSAERLYQALRSDISRGRLRQGRALPLVKQMSIEHSVSPSTVVKACRLLVRDGLVQKQGRSYRVTGCRRESRSHGLAEVFHFASSERNGSLGTHGRRTSLVLGEVFYELANNGVRVFARHIDELPGHLSDWTRRRRYPLGVVVESFYPERKAQLEGPIERFLRLGARPRTAFVLFSDGRRCAVRGVDQFCDGNFHTVRARTIARFVHERGYSSVGVYLQASSLLDLHLRESARMLPALMHLASSIPLRYFIDREGSSLDVSAVMTRLVEGYGAAYMESLLGKHGAATLRDLRNRLCMVDGFAGVTDTLPGDSLCILRDPSRAIAVYEWCRARGIAVPGRLALLEASADLFDLGSPVSSCSCDWRRTGYLIAHGILRDIPVDRTTRGFIPTRTVILERETT